MCAYRLRLYSREAGRPSELLRDSQLTQQSLQAVRSFLMLQAATLIGFLGWFSLLTLLRLDSQYGKCRMRAAGDTPTLGPVYPDSEDLPPYAGELTRSLLGGDEWEQPPPMRVDSFGDIVEDVPRGDS